MENISINIDDLDDDLLEAENDFDFILSGQQLTIPNEQEPTLESILNEDDDLENDEILKNLNQSLTTLEIEQKPRTSSFNSQILIEKNGVVCKQTYLKQISIQLKTAIDRSEAGLPTVLDVSSLIAIGTSRGLVLLFDSNQILKLYITIESKDAISALSLNNTCDRLLVGNSSGLILMYDINGRLLRKITDAHPFGNAILNLKFTDDPKVAVFSDSGGSVFMLDFKRVMGVRSAESHCLFSGSRGEVCHIEPLKFEKFAESITEKITNGKSSVKKNLEYLNALFSKYSLLAMASFTKIFVVSLKPKLTVLYTFPLNNSFKYLPILSWQFVILQSEETKRFITPILTCARESTIHFFQLDYFLDTPDDDLGKKFKFLYSKKTEYNFEILNFTWLNAKTLGILDHSEKLHIFDIKTNEELQCLNINLKLVYNSSFFKSLSTGGYVSKALAYAGENSCYQTIRNHLGQLFMLGTESISLFSLQNWSARIDDFLSENNLDLAIDLALSMYLGKTKALSGLPNDARLRKAKICEKIIDILHLYVKRSIKQDSPTERTLQLLEKHYLKTSQKLVSVCTRIERQDILFNNLYDLISCDSLFEGFFFESLEDSILTNQLTEIPPILIKKFIKYYKSKPNLLSNLEKCLLHFNISNIDFHDVIQTCKKYSLIDAYINLFNKALGDYTTPFEDVLKLMKPIQFLKCESDKLTLDKQVTICGNKLLVYLHCCLCGQGYPYGSIDDLELCDNVRRTTFDYLTSQSNRMIDELVANEDLNGIQINYPIMRIFLNFDIMDFLNVITMSFNEPSFEAVIGLDKKQHLIDILIEIWLKDTNLNTKSYLNNRIASHLFTFLARQVANKNNNIQIDNSIFTQMIEYLCNREEMTRSEEREQTLLSLLNSFSTQLLERFDLDRLLDLCKKAKFYRACEILYEFKSEYNEIIDCYLNDENSIERQSQIFGLIRNILKILYETEVSQRRTSLNRRSTSLEPRDVQLKKLHEKLYQPDVINRMLNLNTTETVHLLWIETNLDLKSLTQSIRNNSNILFKFLKSLFELIEIIKTDRKYINYLSQFGGEYCELYVDLICEFEPDNLISVLKTTLSDYSFRIDECVRICRERKHVDGLAYLLEKSGQIESAFSLHLEKMNSLIKELQKNLENLSEKELNSLKQRIDALLIMIVKLCQTNSCSLEDTIKEKIWFSLFDEVMRPIQSLFIDPSVKELMLSDGDEKTVQRLDETREFFKNLGSYIINSMVGYLNLTTIIDRMICDPLYGASNFGDIKHLMIKMLEMCSYEQTLLNKTSDLVSNDVYRKMILYKKMSAKSFSSICNFCQVCSRKLDADIDTQEISIFHCGHSFHQICLDLPDICPVCNSTSNGVKMVRSKKKEKTFIQSSTVDFLNEETVNSAPTTSKSIEINQEINEKVDNGHYLNLTDGQINALKSIRTRNAAIFNVNKTSQMNYEFNTTLERNSKLNLAPANLIKFI